MRRKLILFFIQALFVFSLLVLQFSPFSRLEKLHNHFDNLIYDVLLYTIKPFSKLKTDDVVIIDIDDKSLQKEGRWPWPRDKIAQLVQSLRFYGVSSIAFDITFTHPDINPVTDLAQKLKKFPEFDKSLSSLNKLAARFDNDQIFAQVLAEKNDSVLGIIFEPSQKNSMGALPKPLVTLSEPEMKHLVVPIMNSYQSNISILQNAVRNAGFVTIIPDGDGIMRRTPLLVRYQNGLYPSLALQTIQLYLLADEIKINWKMMENILAIDSIQLGPVNISTDSSGNIIIPYPGDTKIKFVSATDALHQNVNASFLKDKVVIVGTSALGLSDLHATPLQGVFAGVEIQAIIMSGLMYGNLPYQPIWAKGAEFLLAVIISIGLIIILPFLRAFGIVLCSLVSLIVLISIAVYLLKFYYLILSISIPILTIVGLTFINLFYDLLFEYKKRKQLMETFSQYMPPSRINIIAEESQQSSLKGESKELTVLFADIVNFTQICERLHSADIKELLNKFFTPMTQIIFEHQGTIDKYVGDLIMAFWGAPIPDNNHIKHALDSSLKMIAKKNELRGQFEEAGLPVIEIGIGINTGIMHVGDMGSKYRLAYTVIGDAVNLASRIETLTRTYRVDIAVSEYSRLGENEFIFRLLDKVRVKGKTQAVKIYELICRKENAHPKLYEELLIHNLALDYYFDQAWDEAHKLFEQLSKEYPNTYLYKLYLKRINLLRKSSVHKNWDGVFKLH